MRILILVLLLTLSSCASYRCGDVRRDVENSHGITLIDPFEVGLLTAEAFLCIGNEEYDK